MTTTSIRDENSDRGLYSIAVAAELVGVGVQTLRLYEAKGVLDPQRTVGGTRRYSDADVATVRRVLALMAQGVNITGARLIIELEDANDSLRSQLDAREPAAITEE